MNTNNELMKQIGFWAAIVVGIGAVVAGMIWLVSIQAKAPQNVEELVIENVIAPDDWVKGSRTAKVTLIEYGDFECPGCAQYASVVSALSAEFGDKIAVVYRHFPLPQHTNAIPMIYVAEAAGLQGKFWEMNDMIFANQAKWVGKSDVKSIVTEYAKTLGLDVTKFVSDFESTDLRKKVETIVEKNSKVGITYTPTFFLNGKRIANPRTYADFKAVIETALNEQGG